jgi:hypothetical protein
VSALVASPAVEGRSPSDPVRALQHALYRAAKADPGRRFHALRDKVYRRDVLWIAPPTCLAVWRIDPFESSQIGLVRAARRRAGACDTPMACAGRRCRCRHGAA